MACITVVDDSRVERMLVAGLLRNNPDYRIGFAENGKEALERIADAPPHLVITDLMMPEMDGLELVRELRKQLPHVPVILMTAYGNESIALKALEAGAASYVPKSQQAERLVETVERVLARAAMERHRARLAECLVDFHCELCLENDPSLIDPLINEIQSRMAGIGVGDATERVRTAMALEEAVLNAMYHGNLEITEEEMSQARQHPCAGRLATLVEQRRGLPKFCQRKINIGAHVTTEGVRFWIRDEGAGFDLLPHSMQTDDECFEIGRRRGLMLIRSLMDEVAYNEAGNEVVLVKHAR